MKNHIFTKNDSLIDKEKWLFLTNLQKKERWIDKLSKEFIGYNALTMNYYKVVVPDDTEGYVLCNHKTYELNLIGCPWKMQILKNSFVFKESNYDKTLTFLEELKKI